jgi:hypothetical protein
MSHDSETSEVVPESSLGHDTEIPEMGPELSHDTRTPEADPALSPSRETKTILERIHDAEQRKAIPIADRFRVIQEEPPEDVPETSSSREAKSIEGPPMLSPSHEAKAPEVDPVQNLRHEAETS